MALARGGVESASKRKSGRNNTSSSCRHANDYLPSCLGGRSHGRSIPVQPIQAILAAEQAKGPGLAEIIGGIGWIIGIFALIFTIKNRKNKD